MNLSLTEKLTLIVAECQRVIAEAEKATPGPWALETNRPPYEAFWISKPDSTFTLELKAEDAQLITSSRTFTPAAADAVIDYVVMLDANLHSHLAQAEGLASRFEYLWT